LEDPVFLQKLDNETIDELVMVMNNAKQRSEMALQESEPSARFDYNQMHS
jgi:hypothetical protein